jgi:hypothetical protein
VRVVSPQKNVVEIDGVTGRRYRATDGIYDMHPRDAKAAVKYGASWPSLSGATRRGIGYRCVDCGFGSFFARCSRCGGVAVKEVIP